MDLDARLFSSDEPMGLIADIHSVSLRDCAVDVIVMFEVLEHLYDPRIALLECARILKPGGILALTTPQYWHVHGWPSDYYRYTCYGLRYLCEVAGLSVMDLEPRGGPGLLLYSILVLNFVPFIRWPLVSILLNNVAMAAAWLVDATVFRKNLKRRFPDTVGWVLVAQKPRHLGE